MVAFKVVSDLFDLIVNYLILFVELIGIGILLYAVISAVIGLIKRQPHTRLKLAEGIALSLEFKMGGELLRTVIVREWNEQLHDIKTPLTQDVKIRRKGEKLGGIKQDIPQDGRDTDNQGL